MQMSALRSYVSHSGSQRRRICFPAGLNAGVSDLAVVRFRILECPIRPKPAVRAALELAWAKPASGDGRRSDLNLQADRYFSGDHCGYRKMKMLHKLKGKSVPLHWKQPQLSINRCEISRQSDCKTGLRGR